MVNKLTFTLVIAVFLFAGMTNIVSAWNFNGTVYDVNGLPLNNSNVSILIRDASWSQVAQNYTTTNESGWFSINLLEDNAYLYQISITHRNASKNFIDYVGQSLPAFPYREVSQVSNVQFYLKEAGTINITMVNSSDAVPNSQFSYQVKDVLLGYPISSCANYGSYSAICNVPRDRNYSIMVYPASGSPQHFVPVSFSWNNFSSDASYNLTHHSKYNGTTKTINKQFNVSEGFARVTGYINGTDKGIAGWEEYTVIPFLMEPSNMIFMDYGTLPFNASAWNQGGTDVYNLTSGFYNITLPYSSSETVRYMLLTIAKNGSYYGGYENVTLSGNTNVNFSLYGLMGTFSMINLSQSTGSEVKRVNATRQFFRLINSTNVTIGQMNAHIELTLDYTNYGSTEFTFMKDLSPQSEGAFFSFPMLNVTGFKEINVFSQNYAPKTISGRSVDQIIANANISMSQFSPTAFDGSSGSSISIALYRSNSSCDVPGREDCLIGSAGTMATFSPLSSVMGGGKLSFKMGIGSVTVHYANVDLLASGPPDALFEDNNDVLEATSGGFSKLMRFGSQGPKIYDYVIVSMPYTEGSTSTTGLNESKDVNISLPVLYDEDWKVAWNSSLNGTSSTNIAGNFSHYSARSSEWTYLLGQTICTNDSTLFNASLPCYIDKSNNRIYVRMPHFSGVGPTATGSVTVTTNASATSDGDSSSGGSSSNYWTTTYVPETSLFDGGYTKEMAVKERLKIILESANHYIGVVALTSTTATINISSDPQQVILNVGDTKKIDVDADNIYEVSVKLISIASSKAKLEITRISEAITLSNSEAASQNQTASTGSTTTTTNLTTTNSDNSSSASDNSFVKSTWFWIALSLLVLGIAGTIYYYLVLKGKLLARRVNVKAN